MVWFFLKIQSGSSGLTLYKDADESYVQGASISIIWVE